MKATLPALTLLFLPAGDLSIDYAAERTVEITAETKVVSETTSSSMEIDGEPVEGGRFGGGGGESEYRREVVFSEQYLANDDGAPTKVKRSFDTVEASRSMMFRDEPRETDIESPMEDVTLIITLEDGEALAEVADDGKAERSEMLEGHSLSNLLQGLLPEDGTGEDWEPEAAGVAAALLLDVEGALFPPREMEEGEGGGRGGGGRRGGFGGGRGGSPLAFLKGAEWDTEAKLTGATEDIDGVECAVIELTFEAEGDMPEQGGGRGGRDRAFGLEAAALVDNTFEIELNGKLYFSVEQHRAVMLELEGEFIQETLTERDTQRGSFRMERTQEGTIEHTITLTLEDA